MSVETVWMHGFRSTSTIGSLADVPVRVTAGALLVAGALLCLVGAVALQLGLGLTAYVLAAAVAVAVPVSFLVHELGHAVVARHLSVPVNEVRLLAFGARTRLEEHPRTPRAHVAVAAAGPAASAMLGAAAMAFGAALSSLGHDGLVAETLFFLGAGNVVLGTFNLLPGPPLDGGGIVVGWLWALRGDRVQAARTGVEIGRVLGTALVLAGGAWAVAQPSPIAVWPVAAGLQLLLGARAGAAAMGSQEEDIVLVDRVPGGAAPGRAASVGVIDLVALEAPADASEQAA